MNFKTVRIVVLLLANAYMTWSQSGVTQLHSGSIK